MALAGFMTVYSGRLVNVLDLKPEDVSIEDIAHALGNLCRFGGHTSCFYSVAQHSIRVALSLPPELRLEGLLHDAAEAYLVDLPRPLKMILPDYRQVEHRVQNVIHRRFDLAQNGSSGAPAIRRADESALLAEFVELMKMTPPAEWFDGVVPLPPATVFLSPHEAEYAFLYTYRQIVGQGS